MFLRYRSIQAKKTAIKEAGLKSAIQEKEILKLKVENESEKVKTLSFELEVKQNFTSNLLNELSELEHVSKTELKSIEIYIQNELAIKSSRAKLNSEVEELSSTFFTELNIRHPNLTEIELKLAALIALDMTNKEIGISKNITAESVKTIKYRLKKKLKLETKDSLLAYLKSLI